MKTRINQILFAALFALFILVGNVNAKGSEVEIASSLENVTETVLEVEDWMLNESYWMFSKMCEFKTETDGELSIEDWMTDEAVWVSKEITINQEELEIESWMINANSWDLKIVDY